MCLKILILWNIAIVFARMWKRIKNNSLGYKHKGETTMDYKTIKNGFIEYLKKLNQINPTKNNYDVSSTAQIFSYKDEFEDYLDTFQRKSASISIASASVSNIRFENGKVVGANPINDESTKFLTAMVNDMLSDETFKTSIDANSDGKIDESEIQNFFRKIASNDSNSSDVSFSDVTSFMKNIQTKKTSFDNTNNYYFNNDNNSSADLDDLSLKTNINNMTLEQLQTEKSKRDENLINALNLLNMVNGETDEQVANAKENMQNAKENYENLQDKDNAIPNELKESQKANDKAYVENENEINATKENIALSETEIFKQDDLIKQIDSTLSQLKSSKSNLESQKSSVSSDDKNYAAKISAINTKISSLNSQIEAKEKEKTEAENSLDAMKANLLLQKDKLTKLETQKIELEQARIEIENQITSCASKQTLDALKNYQNLRQTYIDIKTQRTKEAQEFLETAKTQFSEVNAKINELENKKIKNENSTLLDNIFDEDISMVFEYNENNPELDFDGDGKADYAIIKPDNYDENNKYPMIVYLHGGGGSSNPQSQGLIEGMLNSDLKGFNGIVLCPLKDDAYWSNENTANKVIQMTQSAIDKYNIDASRVTLVGFSLGGLGALYLEKQCEEQGKDLFSKMAIISPSEIDKSSYTRLNSISMSDYEIPAMVYSGDAQNDPCYYNAKSLLGENSAELNVVSDVYHGKVANQLMRMDLDNDGCADMIKWLYQE